MTEVIELFDRSADQERGLIKAMTKEFLVTPVMDELAALSLPEIPKYNDPHPNYSGVVVIGLSSRIDATGAGTVVSVRYGDNPASWRAAEPYNPLNSPGVSTWEIDYATESVEVPFARTKIIGPPPGSDPVSFLAWEGEKRTLGVKLTVFRLRTAIQAPSLIQIYQTGAIANTIHDVPITAGQKAWMFYRPSRIAPATQGGDGQPAIWYVEHEYLFDTGNVYDPAQAASWSQRLDENAIINFPGSGPLGIAKPFLLSSLPGASSSVRYSRPPYESVDMVPSQDGIAPISDITTPPTFAGELVAPVLASGYSLVLGVGG